MIDGDHCQTEERPNHHDVKLMRAFSERPAELIHRMPSEVLFVKQSYYTNKTNMK